MMIYLAMCMLSLAALGRHAITQVCKTARLELALRRTCPRDRVPIIRSCAEFERERGRIGSPHSGVSGTKHR
ncbi:hypothetical protein ACWEOG_02015 [Amycolatopsis japonica]